MANEITGLVNRLKQTEKRQAQALEETRKYIASLERSQDDNKTTEDTAPMGPHLGKTPK